MALVTLQLVAVTPMMSDPPIEHSDTLRVSIDQSQVVLKQYLPRAPHAADPRASVTELCGLLVTPVSQKAC